MSDESLDPPTLKPNSGRSESLKELDAPTLIPQRAVVSDSGGQTVAYESFGRYKVERLIGRGGFGEVYLAVDLELGRRVAIKVTRSFGNGFLSDDEFLAEARHVASLDHPGIVPVYDVGRTPGGDYFVVSKFIDGTDLAARLKMERPTVIQSVRWVQSISIALHHSHEHQIVHRDVKPANILLDANDVAYLTDFGIALKESVGAGGCESSGTPGYMSPEQARGEGHRVTSRSDIFSLGVVLYELLCGSRPFLATNLLDLLLEIAETSAKPIREIDPSIPIELERICAKMLAPRALDRYESCDLLAADLLGFLDRQPASGRTRNIEARESVNQANQEMISPKGLRSFDQSDCSSFLQLLPGPRDRNGLPDSIRFWKDRIESGDRAQPLTIGLLFGPSGCGKSSFVKAGLLPNLAPSVISIYVEAAPFDTELRVLRAIQRKLPSLSGIDNLVDILTAIRRGNSIPAGKRVLLVMDQFEQWLHSEKSYASSTLTKALRQCDGERLQTLIMVRDDFWLAVCRFLREVEVSIEANNSQLVDLFDMPHAEKVLGLLGAALGKLPSSRAEYSQADRDFLKLALSGLANDGKIISVQLSLFAEMLKNRPWTVESYQAIGGSHGVGVTFLESIFDSPAAPARYRLRRSETQTILRRLLPEIGTEIKGNSRSIDDLQKACALADQNVFDDLIRMLDSELRLITPVDASTIEGSEPVIPSLLDNADNSKSDQSPIVRYQLTHDYLVPSIREWLVLREEQSFQGKWQLALADRTAVWAVHRKQRDLPKLGEWFGFRFFSKKSLWTERQAEMMRQAGLRIQYFVKVELLAILFLFSIVFQWINPLPITVGERIAMGLLGITAIPFVHLRQNSKWVNWWFAFGLIPMFAIMSYGVTSAIILASHTDSDGTATITRVTIFAETAFAIVYLAMLSRFTRRSIERRKDIDPSQWLVLSPRFSERAVFAILCFTGLIYYAMIFQWATMLAFPNWLFVSALVMLVPLLSFTPNDRIARIARVTSGPFRFPLLYTLSIIGLQWITLYCLTLFARSPLATNLYQNDGAIHVTLVTESVIVPNYYEVLFLLALMLVGASPSLISWLFRNRKRNQEQSISTRSDASNSAI